MSCTVVGKSKWCHQVFQDSFHMKRLAVLLNLAWETIRPTEGLVHLGQVKRHSLPFQVEAVLKYPMVPTTYFCQRLYLSMLSSLVSFFSFQMA